MGKPLPDHCCCCGLRRGAFVIGGFTLVVSLSLTVVLAMRSADLYDICPRNKRKECSEDRLMVVNLYGLTAVLDGLEVLVTCGFLWGVYQCEAKWVTRWLYLSIGWWVQHTVLGIALLMSSTASGNLAFATFIGPFLFSLGYLSLRAVAGLRSDLVEEELSPDSYVVEPRDAASARNRCVAASAAPAPAAAHAVRDALAGDSVQL